MFSVDFSNSFENKTLIVTLMNEQFQVQLKLITHEI